ncbi:MAG TPA: hypothetical protein VJH75_00015 [Patescibacteria group bacterium]|nr:hypothetical protein [Patescibacteria group bacterium]
MPTNTHEGGKRIESENAAFVARSLVRDIEDLLHLVRRFNDAMGSPVSKTKAKEVIKKMDVLASNIERWVSGYDSKNLSQYLTSPGLQSRLRIKLEGLRAEYQAEVGGGLEAIKQEILAKAIE